MDLCLLTIIQFFSPKTYYMHCTLTYQIKNTTKKACRITEIIVVVIIKKRRINWPGELQFWRKNFSKNLKVCLGREKSRVDRQSKKVFSGDSKPGSSGHPVYGKEASHLPMVRT